MTVNTPNSDPDTGSDHDVTRQLLEHIDFQVHEIGQHVAQLTAVLDEFRPLLAMLRGPGGKPDLIGASILRRRRHG